MKKKNLFNFAEEALHGDNCDINRRVGKASAFNFLRYCRLNPQSHTSLKRNSKQAQII